MATFHLPPAGQKHRWPPGLAVGVLWDGALTPWGLMLPLGAQYQN